MVVAALAGAVVFQLALVASFTGAEARPVLHHVTIGLVGPSPASARHVGPLSDDTASYQRFPDAEAARQAVSDGQLPAALIVTGSHQALVVAEASGLTLTAAVKQVATAQAAAALMSLFGMTGIVVAIVAFVVLGNPTSGGSVPVQMLSGGFQFLAEILPDNAGIALVHGIQYFDGNQLGHPLVVLALYAAVAMAVCFVQALRRSRPAPAELPTRPDLQPVAQ